MYYYVEHIKCRFHWNINNIGTPKINALLLLLLISIISMILHPIRQARAGGSLNFLLPLYVTGGMVFVHAGL